jgi:Sulfotransferase family
MSLPPADRTFVFVGGLHRSGTTLVARCLSKHPDISGFANTRALEDEGQFLQSVYPVAHRYGGAGLFGFAPEMHVTEGSPVVTDTNRRRLYAEWSRYWDLECPVLLEKSPPNLLKTRFLQTMFPTTRFVMILRHPIATSFATQKWSHTSLAGLIRHWLICHETMLADLLDLEHVTMLRYEDFVRRGDDELMRLQEFIGLEPKRDGFEPRTGLNEAYFARWQALGRQPISAYYRQRIERQFEARVNRFGYSLRDPELVADQETLLSQILAGRGA